MAGDEPERYRVLEPTFKVEGEGTPLDALAFVLNRNAEDGYRFAGTVMVRGVDAEGRPDREWVHAIVLERDPG